MFVTLSENRFSTRIRELENIPVSVSDEEINHRLDKYAAKLFQHLAGFGFTGFDRVAVNGTLGTFRATLAPCWDDDNSRNTRLQGLAMLDPVSASLEEQDLPAFFVGMLLTAMVDAFDSYAAQFQRVTVSELDAGLQRVAERVAFAPQPQPFEIQTESDAALLQEYNDEQFDLFCLRSGVKNPGAERRKRDAAEAVEAERYQAARKKQIEDSFSNHD